MCFFFRTSFDFDPLLMANILEEGNQLNTIKCQLCGKFTFRSQVIRHLEKFHKVFSKMSNHFRTKLKLIANPDKKTGSMRKSRRKFDQTSDLISQKKAKMKFQRTRELRKR